MGKYEEHTYTQTTTMTQRQSTRPGAPSEKVLAATRDLLSARKPNSSSSMSFRATGESHFSKVAEMPGFKSYYVSGE